MIGLAAFVVLWVIMLIANPVATLALTFFVAVIGGIFMTSGDGDGGSGGRWGDSGWGGGGRL